ncbi:MAG: phosphate ABC transporter permease subunit PstC [Acidimicrobiales bacterium]
MATAPLDLTGRSQTADRSFRWAAALAGFLVLVILGLIAFTMTTRAWPAFRDQGWSFFTSDEWAPAEGRFGGLTFIYGTVVSSAIALVLAVPVSIGIALFITQVVPNRFRKPFVYVVDLLAVIPSVVFGLWGISVLAPWIKERYDTVADAVDGVPVLQSLFGQASGRSFFTAGIILAIMITPIISSLAREVVDTTPPGEMEAAYGLGATRWEMIRGAVIPHSKGGLVGAVMLGLGRAMGETIAVALVIGSSAQLTSNLFASGDSMPSVIANQWGEADGTFKAALIGLAVTLFVMTILVNMAATTVVQRSMRKSRGA